MASTAFFFLLLEEPKPTGAPTNPVYGAKFPLLLTLLLLNG